MKKTLILFAALLLTACSPQISDKSSLSESVQPDTSIESSVSEDSHVQSTDTDSEEQPSDTAEQNEQENISVSESVNESVNVEDVNDVEVGVDRYFALFDDWTDEERAGLEMPYSMQWIMPYIQFDVDLWEYIRASERYPEWQEKYEELGYQDGKDYQPTLYDVISYFNISREEFEEMYSDNIIPDAEWQVWLKSNYDFCTMKESMVDVLFSDDEYLRNSTFCAKESAFVAAADNEVYSGFWMLYNTSAEALETASFTPEELTRFVETIRAPFEERTESEISADGGNYRMAEPLVEFVEEWYAEYMALVDGK